MSMRSQWMSGPPLKLARIALDVLKCGQPPGSQRSLDPDQVHSGCWMAPELHAQMKNCIGSAATHDHM